MRRWWTLLPECRAWRVKAETSHANGATSPPTPPNTWDSKLRAPPRGKLRVQHKGNEDDERKY